MKIHQIRTSTQLPITLEQAWDYFSSARNLEEMTPETLRFRIVTLPSERMYEGMIISYRVMVFPQLWSNWVTEIKSVVAPQQGSTEASFIDEQRFGPYALWHHRHRFVAQDEGVFIEDLVHYALGYSVFGELMHRLLVRKKLQSIFAFRKAKLQEVFGSFEA